jgi:thioredoxin reductase
MYDTVIVGGGPAGLSGALVLARARRRVLLFDNGEPRNRWSQGMHGFLSRDGIRPAEFLEIGRQEVRHYGGEIRSGLVGEITIVESGFHLRIEEEEERIDARTVLLATGVVDRIPKIPGIMDLYGRSVHHCPYCDGWEERDKRLAVYGRGSAGLGLSLSLKTWSDDVILCTDGSPRISIEDQERLARHAIAIRPGKIARLEGEDGRLQRIIFRNGDVLERDSLFFTTGQDQSCGLAASLGCRFTRKGAIWTNATEGTSIPGLYVAGDASRDAQMVIVAAAEGAKAAVAINTELTRRERG